LSTVAGQGGSVSQADNVLEANKGPTPYPGINELLQELLTRTQEILGEQFFGMYLYGSLAAGDFDPDSSDIDFLVVTRSELSQPVIAELESMHLEYASSGSKWARKLEGAYVPLTSLRRYSPDDPAVPTINEGYFYLSRQGTDWVVQRHILREHNSTIQGPPLREWIDPVDPDDLRRAVVGILFGWWILMLRDPADLQRPGYQPFAVLSMCRALYTLQFGTIPSKSEAARWALASLDGRWSALIEQATNDRQRNVVENLDDTQEFIRYVIDQSQRMGIHPDRP